MSKALQVCPLTQQAVHGKSFSRMSVKETNKAFEEAKKKQAKVK